MLITNSSSLDKVCLTASKDVSQFKFYLSPGCVYSVSVGLSFPDIINSLSGVITIMPANVFSVHVILTALTFTSSTTQNILGTLSSLSPLPVIIGSRLLVYMLSLGNISTDVAALTSFGLDFGASPLLMSLLGHAMSFIPLVFIWGLVMMTGHLMVRLSPPSTDVTDVTETAAFSKYPPMASLVLICLSIATCSCVGLLLGFIIYIVHISLLCRDNLIAQTPASLSCVSCHLCLALLWMSQLLLGLPSLMTWSLTPGSVSLTSDTSLIHTICLLSSASILWQRNPEIFTIDEKYKDGLFYCLHFMAVLILPFATVSVYRIGFAISSIFIGISSLILVSMDWNQPRPDIISERHKEERQESVPVKRRGTYKIITSYLETGLADFTFLISDSYLILISGKGEEGLDWELVMTEEGDTAILQFPYYICVSNRVSTLPADFIRDLGETLRLASGLFWLLVSSLWEQPRKPRIEVTVATPDYDYLPDNHPLRKIHIQKSTEEPEEELSKLHGFMENLKKILVVVVQFHYQFYDDLFTVLKIGFGFLFYLISSFPMDMFCYYMDRSRNEETTPFSLESLKTFLALIPAAIKGTLEMITQTVEAVNFMVKNMVQKRDSPTEDSTKKSPSPSVSRSTRKGSTSTSASSSTRSNLIKQEFPRKQSVSAASKKEDSKNQESFKKQGEPLPKKSSSKAATIVRQEAEAEIVPAKSIEAFKSEVKLQEEILKFGKDKDKDIFSGPVVVSGPWIPEKKESFIPGYKEESQDKLPVHEPSVESFKSGAFEPQRKQQVNPDTNKFDAPIPSSSVFERDSSERGFEMKAKVKSGSSANVHSSMYNIHAACELEDDNLEELEKLRDVSPEPDVITYRASDISLDNDDPRELQPSSSSRPLGPFHSSQFTSMLSEAPRESPDLKKKYSVKDEIAQLRQTVREELLNARAAEPDEAIASGVSGESGLDEDYERIHIMKFDKENDRRPRNDLPPIQRRKSSKSRRFSKSPPRAYSPPLAKKDESSDEDIKSWEMIQKDDLDAEDHSLRRNLSASSSGSFAQRTGLRERESSSGTLKRRNRSSNREERSAGGSHSKLRSSSLQPEQRASNEFCEQLAKRLSGEFGRRGSMQDVQVKRRDSFLDISIPMDDSKSAASLESLMFFSKTISDTANSFQQTLNDTAEKFSETLNKTAATLKNAISEKNLSKASTQEISETLHETADLLSKTSEIISKTAKASTSLISNEHHQASAAVVEKMEAAVKPSIKIPNFYPDETEVASKRVEAAEPSPTPRKHEDQGPLRLDTITSMSEADADHSDFSDPDDILRHVPVLQESHRRDSRPEPVSKSWARNHSPSVSPYSQDDPPLKGSSHRSRSPKLEPRPRRPLTPVGRMYRTPFGRPRTSSVSSAKDLFKEVAESRQDNSEYENPVTGVRYRTPSRTRDTG